MAKSNISGILPLVAIGVGAWLILGKGLFSGPKFAVGQGLRYVTTHPDGSVGATDCFQVVAVTRLDSGEFVYTFQGIDASGTISDSQIQILAGHGTEVKACPV